MASHAGDAPVPAAVPVGSVTWTGWPVQLRSVGWAGQTQSYRQVDSAEVRVRHGVCLLRWTSVCHETACLDGQSPPQLPFCKPCKPRLAVLIVLQPPEVLTVAASARLPPLLAGLCPDQWTYGPLLEGCRAGSRLGLARALGAQVRRLCARRTQLRAPHDARPPPISDWGASDAS